MIKLYLLLNQLMRYGRMENKSWKLTYDLITNQGTENIEVQFMYFETCIMTVNNLSKHCNIDNIHITHIK